MLGQAAELLSGLIGTLVTIFDIVYTLFYYAYATIIYGAGAVIILLCWYALCGLSQSVAEHVPVTRWIDRRLQDEFQRKIKNMGYQELNMRARLINAGEDVKMRNEDNGRMLKEICDAENFSKCTYSFECSNSTLIFKFKMSLGMIQIEVYSYLTSTVSFIVYKIQMLTVVQL